MLYKDYLSHHGVLGQKWGVENGPPYPLDPKKDYSAAELKALHLYRKANELVSNRHKQQIDSDYEELQYKTLKNRKLPFGASSTVAAKEVMDRKISQKLDKIQNKMTDLVSKSMEGDKGFDINLWQDQLNKLVDDFESTRLSPELAEKGKALMDKQFTMQFLLGLPGGMITESVNSQDYELRSMILKEAMEAKKKETLEELKKLL